MKLMRIYTTISIMLIPIMFLITSLAKGYGINTHIGKTLWVDISCSIVFINLIILGTIHLFKLTKED